MRYVILFLLIQASVVQAAYSQGNRALDRGVRVGITYAPGTLPGLLILDGERGSFVDSVRAILQRDLDYSDLFELILLFGGDHLTSGPGQGSGPPASDGLLPTPLPFSIQNKTPNGLDYPAQFEDGKQVGQPIWLATQKPGSCTQMGCSNYAKTKPTWIDFEGQIPLQLCMAN